MTEKPIHVSPSTVKSLWHEYRIYRDRLEFDTHLGAFAIPLAHVESIEVSESEARGLLRGDLHLKGFRPAWKLDWANFVEHVVIDMKEGLVRRLLITPDDPEAFKSFLDKALVDFRAERAGS